VLEESLRLMRIEKYGAGGEKLSQANAIVRAEPVVSEMIEQAESEHAPVHRSTEKSVQHPGRQDLPANLPRVERILPCALDQRVAGQPRRARLAQASFDAVDYLKISLTCQFYQCDTRRAAPLRCSSEPNLERHRSKL
jgi:hypothetical protein